MAIIINIADESTMMKFFRDIFTEKDNITYSIERSLAIFILFCFMGFETFEVYRSHQFDEVGFVTGLTGLWKLFAACFSSEIAKNFVDKMKNNILGGDNNDTQ
jgi:hypothetical protein